MKIMHLRSSDLFGSPERLIIGQCRYIKTHNFVCASFVADQGDNRFLKECTSAGIETVAIADSFPGDLRIAGKLKHIIAEQKVDLVVTHDYKSAFYTYVALRKAAVSQIGYFHGVTSENWKVRVYNAVDRWVLRRLKRVITVSEATKQRLAGYGVEPSLISVVPNGIDDSTVIEAPIARDYETQPFRLIAVGRLSFEKGFDILIEAINEVHSEEALPIELDIYGTGPEENKIRKLIDQYQLGHMVRLNGFVPDVIPVLSQADLLVMSSRSEGMPVTILEAWSQALPVLAAAAGGVPELISDNLNGYLVEPENVSALAEKIIRLVRERSGLASVAAAGWKTVREKYTYSRQAQLLSPIYDNHE